MGGLRKILALAALTPTVLAAADARLKYYPVQSVPGSDRVVVEYARLPITVRLAHLQVPASDEARAAAKQSLEGLVKGRKVRVSYSPEAGLDSAGLPQAYIILQGNRNVNAQLVKQGLARYQPGEKPMRYYHQAMQKSQRAAQSAKLGLWAKAPAGAPAPAAARGTPGREPTLVAGAIYAELYGSIYHRASCRWSRQMSPQRRIQYRSVDAAEKVGKRPCWICMSRRAETALMGNQSKRIQAVTGKGPLLGYQGEFHGPTCSKILRHGDECAEFTTADAARAGGLRPCNLCLRLRGGMIPLPERGECAGRAPPHRRPCRRAPADASGLCLLCLGKE